MQISFFLHEIDGQSGVSILWVHTAQLEFGTKTAALQLSGHHACTSRMWETRKLELGQFKKIIWSFGHFIKSSNDFQKLSNFWFQN